MDDQARPKINRSTHQFHQCYWIRLTSDDYEFTFDYKFNKDGVERFMIFATVRVSGVILNPNNGGKY